MDINGNLSQISAEMMLNYFYPELEEKWVARHAGTFLRNYSVDATLVDEEQTEVVLARDGYLRMLPEGLLFDENELKGKKNFDTRYKQLERRRRVFREAFLPFDTFAFRQRLAIERATSQLLEQKLSYVLRTYFGFNLDAEQNPYVREMAGLLPFIREWRADFSRLAKLLGEMVHCKTKLLITRYDTDDNSRRWLPAVEFQLQLPGLSAAEYRQLYDDIRPLEQFLIEWFIPCEVHCRLSIKHHGQPQTVDGTLMLDYNTELNK